MADSDLRADVLAQIQTIIRQVLDDPEIVIRDTTTAADVSGWDSLTHVQIIVAIETAFGIRLKSSEVAQVENVGSLIDIALARRRS
jgi:acyl carrier protein